jgi:hypothetical protein
VAIENEHQLEAAQGWLAYWKETISGESSWWGNEHTRANIARLRSEIREYEKRRGVPPEAAGTGEPETFQGGRSAQ